MDGLVLEGGGMRGVFTAGVTDALLDYGVTFPYIIGASAGASTASNYLAGQRGRARFLDIDMLKMRPYVGWQSLVRGHGFFDIDYLFYEAPDLYYPYDFEAYRRNASRFVIVSTNALTGEAVYTEERQDMTRYVDALRSSCSLPLFCRAWQIDGVPMVDGGVSDSLPFERALADGCQRVVVVLTKEAGYRRSERRATVPHALLKLLGRYPQVVEAMLTRGERYNRQLDQLSELEKQGVAIVVRPDQSHGVGRTTSNIDSLEALYAEGLRQGRRLVDRLAN